MGRMDSETVATPMEVVAEILRLSGYDPGWIFEEYSVVNEPKKAPSLEPLAPSLNNLEFMHQEAVTTVGGGETYNSTGFRIFYHGNGPNIQDVTIEIIPGLWPTFPQPRWNGAFLIHPGGEVRDG